MIEDGAPARAILACALSCVRAEPDDLSQPGDPHALIAPFARRNFYAAAVAMMQGLLRRVGAREGFPPRHARILVNSRVPEKPLAVAAAVGAYGKNSLVIVPGLGSMVVIAACILPLAVEGGRAAGESPVPVDGRAGFPHCGSCTRCIDACPVGAIVEPGVVDPARCLQGLAEAPALLAPAVMEKWGRRLYGCQDCQSACPHNAGLPPSTVVCPGEVGPSVSIRRVLEAGTAGVKGMFRGSTLGMRRIHPVALVRNALIAAGASGEASLCPAIEPLLHDPHPVLAGTARWALSRLGRDAGATCGS